MQPCLASRPGGRQFSFISGRCPSSLSPVASTGPLIITRGPTSRESASHAAVASCSSNVASSYCGISRNFSAFQHLRPHGGWGAGGQGATAAITSPRASNTVSLANLEQMTETQRHVLADEWGYTSLGEMLPDGARLEVLARSIPDELLSPDVWCILRRALAPAALMAAGYFWMW